MQIKNILHKSKLKPYSKLNVLCIPAHERYESGWAKTGHNFFGLCGYQNTKNWSTKYAPVPPNYTLLDALANNNQLPTDLAIDCVVCHSKSHHHILKQWSQVLQVPLINIEHCIPPPLPNVEDYIDQAKSMVGDLNVYISKDQIGKWGNIENDTHIAIYHGINQDIFNLPENSTNVITQSSPIRINDILCVMNDVIGRSLEMGGDHFIEIQRRLNNKVKLVGDNGNLGKAAESTEELAKEYQSAKVFINTTLSSTIPMSMLEAAACGCAIVARPTGCIKEFFTHKENVLFYDTIEDAIGQINHLIYNQSERTRLGNNANSLISTKFNMGRFVKEWNDVFERARIL